MKNIMKRRDFLKATALLTGANAGVSALSHLRGEAPAARHAAKAATGAVVRNSIELRNDAAGDDYFFAFVRSDVIQPQRKYFLGNKPDDTWIGTTPTRGGRPLPDNVLWPIEMEYAQPDGMSGRHPFLDLPTIPAQHGHIKYVACDKYTAGCNLSHTFQDHQKDWDFLESKLREILTAARLTDAASDWDKVSAVANFCVQTRIEKKNRSRWMHPVDFCLHGANCLGAANTLVGFCSVLGLPARTISYAGHTTSEVLLDGKWRWVENTVATVQAMKARGPVQAVSFLDQLNDPASQVAGEELVNKYAEFNCVYDQERSPFLQFNHEAYTNWIFFGTLPYRYEPPRATSGMGSLREVSALYPEQKGVRYKCDRLPKVWLTPFRLPWSERPEYLTVDQDHGIRQEFYVPSGRPIKALTSLLVLAQAEFKFLHNVPRDGGDWYYKINEHKVYIRDLGGWNFRTDHAATGRNCLELSIRPEWLI